MWQIQRGYPHFQQLAGAGAGHICDFANRTRNRKRQVLACEALVAEEIVLGHATKGQTDCPRRVAVLTWARSPQVHMPLLGRHVRVKRRV